MAIVKELVKMNVADLVPYENNPRRNDEAVAAVVESMKQCENIDPIEVDEHFVILSGHTRHKAMLELGIEETDVMVVSGLTEEQKKKYRILANKTGEFAGWDFTKLQEELEELDFGDFDFGLNIEVDGDREVERTEVSFSDGDYQIIIDCVSESDMESKFNQLKEIGIECRLSTL